MRPARSGQESDLAGLKESEFNMKKKLLSLLLALCFAVSLMPAAVYAAPEQTEQGPTEAYSEGTFPEKFDLRDRGVVTPVKLQNPWGTCWAFGDVAAAEISILTAMGKTYEETGLDLSERHLAWYAKSPLDESVSASQGGEGYYPISEETGPNDRYEYGATGNISGSLWAMGMGPVYEAEYPYQNNEGSLEYETLIYHKDEWLEARTASLLLEYSWYLYNGDMTEDDIAQYALEDYEYTLAMCTTYDYYSEQGDWTLSDSYTGGAAFTLTDANTFYYSDYVDDAGTGILPETISDIKRELMAGHGVAVTYNHMDEYLDPDTWAQYAPSHSSRFMHEACIVGWDDSYPTCNFTNEPPADGAWLVKNSFGSETDLVPDGLTASDGTTKAANGGAWGITDEEGRHTGYFWLSYYDTNISHAQSYVFRAEPNTDLMDALQYDYVINEEDITGMRKDYEISMANIYPADRDLCVTEVGTWTEMVDDHDHIMTDFNVRFELYRLNEDAASPTDGVKVSTLERHFDSIGYHRVELDRPVYLKEGDRLSVVVTLWHENEDGTRAYSCPHTYHSSKLLRSYLTFDYAEIRVNRGESYIYLRTPGTGDDRRWIDIAAPMDDDFYAVIKGPYSSDDPGGESLAEYSNTDNFCIKAFTKPYTLGHVDAAPETENESGCVEHWLDPETGVAYADEYADTPLYAVSVTDGKADNRLAKEGDIVTVTATPDNNSVFVRWNVTGGYAVPKDGSAQVTSFVMPGEDVTISAVISRKSGGGSGGGGGGGGSANTSPVSIGGTGENGTVTVSRANAAAGQLVTVTATPKEGYKTANVTVTDKSGNNVAVTKNADGTYSFTMPASEVTITPTFVKSDGSDVTGCPKDASCPIAAFADASPAAWYHDGVHWALDEGVMNGVGDGLFDPDGSTTRAMVVTMLWRMEGSPEAAAESGFDDVDGGAWYAEAVSWAKESGAVNGTSDAAFSPDSPITREQLATILYRCAQSKGEGFTGMWAFRLDYPDADKISEYAYEPVCFMTMNGIMTGMGDGTLNPAGEATRAQIATMFMRFDAHLMSAQATGE